MNSENETTKKLKELIKTVIPEFNPGQLEEILENNFRVKQLEKGETLLSFHSVCRHYYFVNKGALRIFFVNDGKEYTSWFAFENYFFTELESYTNQSFSNFCITAIEATEVLEINKNQMESMLKNYDWWKIFLLENQKQIILKLAETLQSFQTQSAKERYDDLFRIPNFIQRTKQKDLSSMFGITKHTLSRIRKK